MKNLGQGLASSRPLPTQPYSTHMTKGIGSVKGLHLLRASGCTSAPGLSLFGMSVSQSIFPLSPSPLSFPPSLLLSSLLSHLPSPSSLSPSHSLLSFPLPLSFPGFTILLGGRGRFPPTRVSELIMQVNKESSQGGGRGEESPALKSLPGKACLLEELQKGRRVGLIGSHQDKVCVPPVP